MAAARPAEVRGLARELRLGRDRVDLGEQHGEKLFLWHCAVKLTFLENDAFAAAAGDADVRVARLRGTVHNASHDRDRDRNFEPGDVRLDGLDRRHHVVLEPAAGRARDESRGFVAEGKRLQDLVRDANLLTRIRGGERDADRIADALGEQDAHAHRAPDAPRFDRAGLGDPEVDRIRTGRRALAVGHDVRPDVGRLQRGLDEARPVVELLQDLAVAERDLDHAIRGLLAVVAVKRVLFAHALVHLFGQRAGVDPDPERDLALLGGVDYPGDLVAVGDVARVEAQTGHARLDRQQRQGVVVVDVGDHRQWRALDDLLDG